MSHTPRPRIAVTILLAVLAQVVVLTWAPGAGAAVSPRAEDVPVPAPAELTQVKAPSIKGVKRWGRKLTASPGAWSPGPASVRYRWLRDGVPIAKATGRRYVLQADDFGTRVSVRVTVSRPGYADTVAESPRTIRIKHRVKVRRTFTYSIATRGEISADKATFARLAAQTYADPRGWRSAGYRFKRVARGGQFTLYLANAGTLPSFGYPCSSTWSCRSGRNVIINQTRWLHASPAWNAAHLSLRDYRHMVVNHETGHWLGHRHRGCPGRGKPAPVMMQQSKGLGGCRFNPFPLPSERWTSR